MGLEIKLPIEPQIQVCTPADEAERTEDSLLIAPRHLVRIGRISLAINNCKDIPVNNKPQDMGIALVKKGFLVSFADTFVADNYNELVFQIDAADLSLSPRIGVFLRDQMTGLGLVSVVNLEDNPDKRLGVEGKFSGWTADWKLPGIPGNFYLFGHENFARLSALRVDAVSLRPSSPHGRRTSPA